MRAWAEGWVSVYPPEATPTARWGRGPNAMVTLLRLRERALARVDESGQVIPPAIVTNEAKTARRRAQWRAAKQRKKVLERIPERWELGYMVANREAARA